MVTLSLSCFAPTHPNTPQTVEHKDMMLISYEILAQGATPRLITSGVSIFTDDVLGQRRDYSYYNILLTLTCFCIISHQDFSDIIILGCFYWSQLDLKGLRCMK